MANERITIEGKSVEASMEEGASARVELSRFLQLLAPPVLSTAGTVLPEGVRMIYSTRTMSILIWERGAGETLSSGSSACAAAAAAVRLGLVRSPVAVRTPGGTLTVSVDEHFDVTLAGEVAEVARGRLSPAFLRTLL